MSHECPHCGLPPIKKSSRIPTHSPYETQLGTNIAFTAHDDERVNVVNLLANLNAHIADLDHNIEKLEIALATTKKERDETIVFRDAHLSLFPPIHQLPAEVLLEIFHLTFDKPYDVSASSRSGPWLLGKICHRWRQVAWSCTSLWTSFTLVRETRLFHNLNSHKVGTKALLEGALSRSAKRNKFHIPLDSLKKTQISDIAQGAESWHDASFEGSLWDFEPFLKIDKMPSLVALGLDISHGKLDAYYQLLSSLGKHVPQLRRLSLAIREDINLSQINFPWRQLTELSLPLDRVVLCQQLLTCCPDLETLKDHPHVFPYERVDPALDIPGLQAVVSHSKLTFIDMSPSLAITLLDHIRCPALTRLSLPCPRANQSDREVLQRFIHRSQCTIRTVDLTFDEYAEPLVSPKTSLSVLSRIIDLKLSFGANRPQGRFLECLSNRAVMPKLRALTVTATTISRPIWETDLKNTLIRVLSARYQSPEESSSGTNLQEVVVALGRETYMLPGEYGRQGSIYYFEGYSSEEYALEKDKRRLSKTRGRDCTIEDLVDADFIEFRKLKERGLDIRLSIWKGRMLIRYV